MVKDLITEASEELAIRVARQGWTNIEKSISQAKIDVKIEESSQI